MSFSRLLLVAANSKKCIVGEGNDKVCISRKIASAERDAYEGEVILCFQLDEKTEQGRRVPRSLGIPRDSQRCDGLVFYAQDDTTDRVVCLVEMKSTNISGAADQIIATKAHIEDLLRKECSSLPEECSSDCHKQIAQIIWKACLYQNGASQDAIVDFQKELKKHGFSDVERLNRADNDLRTLLSGGRNAKEMAKKFQRQRKR